MRDVFLLPVRSLDPTGGLYVHCLKNVCGLLEVCTGMCCSSSMNEPALLSDDLAGLRYAFGGVADLQMSRPTPQMGGMRNAAVTISTRSRRQTRAEQSRYGQSTSSCLDLSILAPGRHHWRTEDTQRRPGPRPHTHTPPPRRHGFSYSRWCPRLAACRHFPELVSPDS